MGAAAFLIAEFTGTPYLSLIRHAFLPALVSYIALLYIVHLEALKLGLEGRPRPPAQTTLLQRIAGVLAGFVGMEMGGTQALSRSTYSKLIPKTENTCSYFSFYQMSMILSVVLGTFMSGIVDQLTGCLLYTSDAADE